MKQDLARFSRASSSNNSSGKLQNQMKRERRVPKCLCGKRNFIRECQYINSASQKSRFIENNKISKKIRNWLDEHIEKYVQINASIAHRKGSVVAKYLQD